MPTPLLEGEPELAAKMWQEFQERESEGATDLAPDEKSCSHRAKALDRRCELKPTDHICSAICSFKEAVIHLYPMMLRCSVFSGGWSVRSGHKSGHRRGAGNKRDYTPGS